jgi:DNA-binding NarL/FixJ family response regulator
MAEAAYVNIWE